MDIVVRPLPVLSSMILAWVALFILYIMLRRFLYEPVTKFLSERQENISKDLDSAKILKDEAAVLKLDYESRIDSARVESQEILESARKRGEELREDIISDAKKEAADIIESARRQISLERDAAFQDIKSQTGELGILIASKVLEEQIDMDKQNILIDKFIDEVGNSKWQS